MSIARIGDGLMRTDAEDKLRGRALYTIDQFPQGVLYAALCRAKVAAGRIRSIDTSGASQLAGVRAVIVGSDAPGRTGMGVHDRPLMAVDMIRYYGEPIAAVAADTIDIARAAADRIVVDVEALEPVLTISDSLAEGAPLVHPEWDTYVQDQPGQRQGNIAWEATVAKGDTHSAFHRNDVSVIESTFEVGRQNQAYLEPRVCIAEFTDGRYEVTTSTQVPWAVRHDTAQLLGVPESRVRVVVPPVGGAFGGKFEMALEPFAALLAERTRCPVRVENSRQEEMLTAPARDNAEIRVRSAVDPAGHIVAREATVLMDAGAYGGETIFLASMTAYTLGGVYEVPAIRLVTQVVYTNTPPTGAFRSCNGAYNSFALERHTQEICRVLGSDPLEFKKANVVRDGSLSAVGQRSEGDILLPLLTQLDTMRQQSSSTYRDLVIDQRLPDGRLFGESVVVGGWFVFVGPSSCTVNLSPDGSLTVVTAGVEIGSGSMVQGLPQIVSHMLGLDSSKVRVIAADTDASGYDLGIGGGRTTVSLGGAASVAVLELKKKMMKVASDVLECAVEDLEYSEGSVRVRGVPEQRMSVADIAEHAQVTVGPLIGSGSFTRRGTSRTPGCLTGHIVDGLEMPIYSAHNCELAVDPVTGRVEILAYRTVQDVGRAINPSAIRGQIQGGIIQGLGYALHEEITFNEYGVIEQENFASYRAPRATDSVRVESELFEGAPSYGPFGAKGAGEIPIMSVGAAVACALASATGVRVQRLPLTPPRVQRLIRGTEGSPVLSHIASDCRRNAIGHGEGARKF